MSENKKQIVTVDFSKTPNFPRPKRGSRIKSKKAKWLWYPYIPLGAVTMLDGAPGIGKSHLLVDIAARLSTGGHFENSDRDFGVGSSLFLSDEDDEEIVIMPRYRRLKGKGGKIDVIGSGFPLNTKEGLEYLESLIEHYRPKFVVIDPWFTFIAGTKTDNASESVDKISALSAIAKRYSVSIVCVRHTRKSGGKAIDQGMGSISIIGNARSGLLVIKDGEDSLMLHHKANLGPKGPTLRFNCGETFQWLGTDSMTVDDVDNGKTQKKQTSARRWLVDYLDENGPTRWEDIVEASGHTEITLRRARDDLKEEGEIEDKRDDGKHRWRLIV